MYSFGSSGGLKSTLSRAILQGVCFIMYAHLPPQATLFAYRTLFRFRYADPLHRSVASQGRGNRWKGNSNDTSPAVIFFVPFSTLSDG